MMNANQSELQNRTSNIFDVEEQSNSGSTAALIEEGIEIMNDTAALLENDDIDDTASVIFEFDEPDDLRGFFEVDEIGIWNDTDALLGRRDHDATAGIIEESEKEDLDCTSCIFERSDKQTGNEFKEDDCHSDSEVEIIQGDEQQNLDFTSRILEEGSKRVFFEEDGQQCCDATAETIEGYDQQNLDRTADILPDDLLLSPISTNLSVDLHNPRSIYCQVICEEISGLIKKKKPKDARQFLSMLCGNMTRKDAIEFVDRRISKKEWSAAIQHRIFPGPGEPMEKTLFIAHRQRVKEKTLIDFIEWLKADGYLQNLSFGQKVVRYFNHLYVPIESVKRTNAISKIIESYYRTFLEAAEADMQILDDSDEDESDTESNNTEGDEGEQIPGMVDHGYESDSDDDSDENNEDANPSDGNGANNAGNKLRCKANSFKHGLRCYRERNHPGQHQFTPENLLSPSTIYRSVSELTSGEIKSRAGLDNIDVHKGHENFVTMRSLVHTFGSLTHGQEKIREEDLLQRIDAVEEFHKVDFQRHLGGKDGGSVKYACMCIQCGFYDEEIDPIKCPCDGKHHAPCKQCQDSVELIMELHDFHEVVQDELEKSDTYNSHPELHDDVLQWKDDLCLCFENLLEYRAHMVHKHTEAQFDKEFYSSLKIGEAVVIIDYKMKILASKHRESQRDWFSKRGSSLLGAEIHIMTENGMVVMYHFFISDNSTQDTEAVLCAKHFLYQEVLSKYNVKTVRFRSDGAKCFSSAMAKCSMKTWHSIATRRGGCYETAYKVMVAGCGKTALDGKSA